MQFRVSYPQKTTDSKFQALFMNTNFLTPVFKRWLVGEISIIKILQIVRIKIFVIFDHKILKMFKNFAERSTEILKTAFFTPNAWKK